MGVRASNTCEIILENVRVPKENLFGDEKKGFGQFLFTLRWRTYFDCMLFRSVLHRRHLKKHFNMQKNVNSLVKSISKFQAIQFKLADMAMEIELARNQVYKAAWLKDQGKPFGKEAAFAKLFASEMGFRVCNQAIQIHGG